MGGGEPKKDDSKKSAKRVYFINVLPRKESSLMRSADWTRPTRRGSRMSMRILGIYSHQYGGGYPTGDLNDRLSYLYLAAAHRASHIRLAQP
jgi:hypothetical protein